MIEVRNLTKRFGNKVILEDISASMYKGKCNLIIGASGSGKTVLTKCIVGLLNFDAGDVLFEGKNTKDMTDIDLKNIRRDIGMLFQGSALFDSMTVEQNIEFPLNMFTNHSHRERLKRVNEVLKRVDLEGSNKLLPGELSGGMKKRVAIARAIVLNPKFLFCDEPNSGLDPKTSVRIDKLIQEITLEYNITTVQITHDMNSVMEIGDHIIFINQGKKEWEGNKEEVLYTENKQLVDFIFVSEFLREYKDSKNKNHDTQKK
ncbi:MAG: ATP-binding cassette domain-containing protein [Phycisphaerales bacterium]|nr:ATP-binding cassette domain-containing protein [Phycisphaerales bacterium]